MSSRRFYHGLRFKLLLISLSLLVIPLMGYRFIQQMELFLRQTQDQHLLTTATTLAQLLSRSDLITKPSSRGLYVHSLKHAPIMDGYDEDWLDLKINAHHFGEKESLAFTLLLGETSTALYLMIEVTDNHIDYTQQQISAGTADQVILEFTNPFGIVQRYMIAPRAPGWVVAYPIYPTDDGLHIGPADRRIRGEWQETSKGYGLELKLPKPLLGDHLGIEVTDYRSDGNLQLKTSAEGNVQLKHPSPDLLKLLQNNQLAGNRLSIVDNQGYILAQTGNLESPAAKPPEGLLAAILNLLLRHSTEANQEIPSGLSRLNISPVLEVLQGETTTYRRRHENANTLLLSAAAPITHDDKIVGAIMVEESTDAILTIQNLALQQLVRDFMMLFAVVIFLLLGYASLLTGRIRKLHKQVSLAVTTEGRIVDQINPPTSKDEIGDLGRSFSSTLSRLQEYNQYLEAMASRLAHELRTPLTIVRTSLDNYHQVDDIEKQQTYLQRASSGADRLDLILHQLQEATRLEKTIQGAELSAVDLCELMAFNRDNFTAIYPQINFIFEPCDQPIMAQASPELICQALEKLVSNAVDFHTPESPIQLSVEREHKMAWLCVTNKGKPLAQNTDLFQSMISHRTKNTQEPHLGLGLYLVKLIAEFHQGSYKANNSPDAESVKVQFSLPIMPVN